MTEVLDWLSNFLYAAMLAGVPLLFGTLGEIFTEKAGNMNLGVEGMMYMGAVFGFMGGYYFDSVTAAILLAFLGGLLGAAIYAFLTVTLKANQNVTGLTLTIFGTGLANMLGTNMMNNSETGTAVCSDFIRSAFRPMDLGFLTEIPYIGKLLFNHSLLTYIGVVLAVIAAWYLNHTSHGLNLRAVGENPAAADAAGVNVSAYKYVHILLGGGISGLGGAYIALVTCGGSWTYNCVGGQGWIAVALVIFAAWSPAKAIFGSLIFGALSVLRLYIPASVIDIPAAVFSMVPFLATCVILVLSSIRMKREKQQPHACGINYFREER
jgi:general nucleoside transport system permease protein